MTLIGKILTCVLAYEFYVSSPPEIKRMGTIEMECIVLDQRGPHDIGDNRISVQVDCSKALGYAKLTESRLNHKVRWTIYEEDCF